MPKPHWTNNELDLLIEKYGRVFPEELLRLFPERSQHSIHNKAHRLGLVADRRLSSKRWRNLVEDYFSSPTERNSYWAGLIAADGNVFGGKMLALYQSDESLIRRFAETVHYEGPILSKLSRLSTRPNYYVQVYSRSMVDDLRNVFNIVPAKSLVLQPPSGLSPGCSLAFIVGYVDGDGYITISAQRKLIFGVLGTRQFLQWVKSVLGTSASIFPKPVSSGPIASRNTVYELRAYGAKAEECLYQLHDVSAVEDLRLLRKWRKVDDWRVFRASQLHCSDKLPELRSLRPEPFTKPYAA